MILIGNTKIHNIISVVPLDNYLLQIEFDDDLTKILDMKPFIGGGISDALKDKSYFNEVYLDNGAITWPNGYDICPVFIRNKIE